MTRTLIPARTQATASAIALLATIAIAASASPAAADVEIPLGDAISPQYHVPDVAAVAEVPAAAPIPDPVLPAPAAPPAPAVAQELVAATQYHPEATSDNGEDVSKNGAATAAPEPPLPEPPPDVPAAVDVPDAPAIHLPEELPVDVLGEQPADEPEEPAVELPDELPIALPALAPAAPAPSAPAGNVNISIRIFSPGDDGPVTQTSGGSDPVTPTAAPVAAPTTWIWNWTWTGGPGCDTGPVGDVAPPAGDWTWNWTWTCGGAETAPGPDLRALPGVEAAFGSLAPIAQMPAALVRMADVPGLAALGTPRPAPAAGSAGAFARGDRATHRRPHAAPAAAPPVPPRAAATVSAAPSLTTAAADEPPRNDAAARRRGRDTTRPPGSVSARHAPTYAPIAAASAAAAAASAGASPAVLATLICLLISFLAGTLLEVAGLPRLLLRAARLERPG